jgi:hypothetical protein
MLPLVYPHQKCFGDLITCPPPEAGESPHRNKNDKLGDTTNDKTVSGLRILPKFFLVFVADCCIIDLHRRKVTLSGYLRLPPLPWWIVQFQEE